MDKPWKLIVGIHRGTITSRDCSDSYHDTLDECRERFLKDKNYYSRMCCQIWFATAHGPQGETVQLSQGAPYR